MSKYVSFTGIVAAPEPPSCNRCNGRCCRDDLGYRIEHMAAECYEHYCEACSDGTVPVPVWTAEDERAAAVAYLRSEAFIMEFRKKMNLGRLMRDVAADAIERGDHIKEKS